MPATVSAAVQTRPGSATIWSATSVPSSAIPARISRA